MAIAVRPNEVLEVEFTTGKVECVISETKRFAVVETVVGVASIVALRPDPRSLNRPELN
jgi:hypothetical protein